LYLPRRKAKKRVCPLCNGAKKVKEKRNGDLVVIVCPRCDGEGFV